MEYDNKSINGIWERRILGSGADFVRFVSLPELMTDAVSGYTCAVLFGKALSGKYVDALRLGQPPERKEFSNAERKMDVLADKVAAGLNAEGYASVARLKTGLLPHKTIALRAGLGFIGKNNLLVTPEYGCAVALGKVLTAAPFDSAYVSPMEPKCGECDQCVAACPTNALLGTTWTTHTTREQILDRKMCALCLRCMVFCPYTAEYAARARK